MKFCALKKMLPGLVLLCVLSPGFAATQDDTGPAALIAAGDYGGAIARWQQTLAGTGDAAAQADLYLDLAAAYQQLGEHPKAMRMLEHARAQAESSGDQARIARALAQTSDAWLVAGNLDQALQTADRALAAARAAKEPGILARTLNNLGNVLAIWGFDEAALKAYQEGMDLAADSPVLAAQLSLNRLKTVLYTATEQELQLQDSARRLAELPDTRDTALLLLTFGSLLIQLVGDPELSAEFSTEANATGYAAFQRAARLARTAGDVRATSLAYGRLAELYEARERYEEALKLNRQALFFANQGDLPELRYLWEWQQGRLFAAQSRFEPALAAYRNAIATLKPVRYTLNVGYRMPDQSFNESVRPVYYQLAELLLNRAREESDPAVRQGLLRRAREAVETLKTAELENYFKDACVAAQQKPRDGEFELPPGTALIYPIPLPLRMEILLDTGAKLEAFEVDVDSLELADTLVELRAGLQTRPDNRFLGPARSLYSWLIEPLLPRLREAQVDTLVFVPDGQMRTIPFGTLHDGENFLIEEFATAVVPTMNMLDTAPDSDWVESGMLLVGLSESVQEYPPLPSVDIELNTIEKTVDGNEAKLLNAGYTTDSFETTLRAGRFSVVHMATHGEFSPDPEHTYLLTYSDKLKIDKLEDIIGLGRFREQPLELLTLSACRTAVGDDKAALGLAGVAVKAGARSAIASLWFVDDEATSLAMRGFYREVTENPGLSKAKALQQVQKNLIAQQRYWHPAYWAPYLLIGNWL